MQLAVKTIEFARMPALIILASFLWALVKLLLPEVEPLLRMNLPAHPPLQILIRYPSVLVQVKVFACLLEILLLYLYVPLLQVCPYKLRVNTPALLARQVSEGLSQSFPLRYHLLLDFHRGLYFLSGLLHNPVFELPYLILVYGLTPLKHRVSHRVMAEVKALRLVDVGTDPF